MTTSRLRLCVPFLVSALLSPVPVVLSAQCSVAANTGENFYVKDSLGGCRSTPVAAGKPVSMLTLRRGTKSHIIMVRHFIDQYKQFGPEVSAGTVTNTQFGRANNIGFVEFDLNVPPGANLGDLTVSFGPVGLFWDPIHFKFKVIRRGEITTYTQSPSPARWGDDVGVAFTGNDIENADIAMASHSIVSGSRTGNATALAFKAKANTGSVPKTNVEIVVWDASSTRLLRPFIRRGHPTPGSLTYSANSGGPACISVPGIAAPALTAPATGAVMTFASATEPLRANVTFSWTQTGDPQRSYILHIEKSPLATTTARTSTFTPSTTGSIPATTQQTVTGPTSGANVSATVSLERNKPYAWKVRPVNCNQGSTFSTVSSFTVK
jgi:hypothetical protein